MQLLPAQANHRGIVAMSLAMGLFIANDALVKYVSASLPAAQLVFIRGLFATSVLLLAAIATGALRPAIATTAWQQLTQRPVLLRAGLDAIATMAYLSALFQLPIANASAINLAAPTFIALYAAMVWKERVQAARWVAIGAGFAGVLLIVQPAADGFNAWSLVCLFATVLQAARDLVTRRIALAVPSILITLATSCAVVLLTGPLSLIQGWAPIEQRHLVLLATASLFLSAAYFLVIVAMRTGDMSLIAPFRYSSLLFALLIGWLVWNDIPNLLSWAGITLIVLAGLAMLHIGRPAR